MSTPYFLAKRGKVFGPFTSLQIQEMKSNDTLLDYSFIWNPQKNTWMQLDTPPAPPHLPAETSVEELLSDLTLPTQPMEKIPAEPASHTGAVVRELKRTKEQIGPTWEDVLCFSLNEPDEGVYKAKLERCSERGGVLLVGDAHASVPFSQFQKLVVSVLENQATHSEKSHTVQANVMRSIKTNKGWEVHLLWQKPKPQFL